MIKKLKTYIREKYNQRIINSADKVAPLRGKLSKEGYLVIENYFGDEDLEKFDLVSKSLDGSKEYKNILQSFPFLCKILFDENIIAIIRDYLGQEAVLDYASARRFLASGAKSDTWHHDSVGHRIKIFLCLNDQDLSTHTQIIPDTHLVKYKSYSENQIGEDIVQFDSKIKKVVGKKNDLIIFDTNLMHKGIYSEVPREIVQFEFSNIQKSKLNGHIGMRTCRFDKCVLKSKLIVVDKLKHSDDYVYYQ